MLMVLYFRPASGRKKTPTSFTQSMELNDFNSTNINREFANELTNVRNKHEKDTFSLIPFKCFCVLELCTIYERNRHTVCLLAVE